MIFYIPILILLWCAAILFALIVFSLIAEVVLPLIQELIRRITEND